MAFVDTPANLKVDREFIRESMSTALLSRERELMLARQWREQDDEEALHELVMAYMRLVISTASRFRNYGLPMADLVQEGATGLMQAAARFEPEREVRFSTYAAWWIRSAMQDYILRNWSVVRTGTTAAQKALFFNLRRLRAKIDDGSGGPLDDAGPRVHRAGARGQRRRRRGDGDAALGRRPVAQRDDQPDRRGRMAGLPRRRAADARRDGDVRARQPHALDLAGAGAGRAVRSRADRSSRSAGCATRRARSRISAAISASARSACARSSIARSRS